MPRSHNRQRAILLGVTDEQYKELLEYKVLVRDLESGENSTYDLVEAQLQIQEFNKENSIVWEVKDRRFAVCYTTKFQYVTIAGNVPQWNTIPIKKATIPSQVDELMARTSAKNFLTCLDGSMKSAHKLVQKIKNAVMAVYAAAHETYVNVGTLDLEVGSLLDYINQEYETVIKMGVGTSEKKSIVQDEDLKADFFVDFKGEEIVTRAIDNANTQNISGKFDKEVQSRPLYCKNTHVPEMGTRFRPFWEKCKDKVPFYQYYKYEAPEVEADLYGELRLEALFQERSHDLLLHLKNRARRFLQKYDMRNYTRQEQKDVIAFSCAMAMTIDTVEEKCKSLIERNSNAMRQHAKFWRKTHFP